MTRKIGNTFLPLLAAASMLLLQVSMPAFAASDDAPPSIGFSFEDTSSDDVPPALSTSQPKPVIPPPQQPTKTVSTATPKEMTQTGPGLLYPIALGIGSLVYFRRKRKT